MPPDQVAKILKMEEGHMNWAEAQRDHVEQLGLASYLTY
jgi:bacterioferritin (cytochrome b1)